MDKTTRRTSWGRAATGLLLLVVVSGCAGAAPLLTADPTGTSLYQQGQDALAEGEWGDAISAFDTLLRNYSSSPFLAEARLGMGRAYYEQGRTDSLIMAVDAFQGFLTYHPSHPFIDVAQYMVGMTYVAQMGTADRDQAPTHRAIDAFDVLINNYPDSHLVAAAEAERLAAVDLLAEHELEVAKWSAGREYDWDAAVDRVSWALDHYPETTLKCDLYYTLARAYKKGAQLDLAIRYYEIVINEYPECELVDEAEDSIRELNGK